MIQLNLLPAVKSKYIEVERNKRLTILSAIIISGVAIGVFVIFCSLVYGAQKIQLKNLDDKIKKNSAQLQDIDGLSKILTVQNQLNSLTSLHSQKPVTSRLFTFLPQIVPNKVYISSLNLKFSDNTVVIGGTAESLEVVNKFIDTLKFTKYSTDTDQAQNPAFNAVVLASFSRTDKEAAYSVSANFDPKIFSGDFKAVSLLVPNITTTRSQTEQPETLYKPQATDDTNGGVQQ